MMGRILHPALLWFSVMWLCIAALTALLNPPFQCPDEPAHLAYSLYNAHERRLPLEHLEAVILELSASFRFWQLVDFPEPSSPPSRFYEAPLLRMKPTQLSKPTLYYSGMGTLLRFLRIDGPLPALIISRGVGLALSFGAAMLLLLIGGQTQKESSEWLLWACGLMTPQYVYMAGAVNPANLAWLASAMTIYGSIRLLVKPDRVSGWLWGLTGIVLGLVSHRSSLLALPGFLLSIFLVLYRRSVRGTLLNRYRVAACIGSAGVMIWILISNRMPGLIRLMAHQIISQFRTLDWIVEGSPWNLEWWTRFGSHFGASLVLNFGWLKHPAPGWYYYLYILMLLPVVPGILILMQRSRDRFVVDVWMVHGINIVVAVCVVVLQFGLRHELTQGRYLFPVWPSIVMWVCAIWNEGIPSGYREPCRKAVFFLSLGMLLYSIAGVLIPRLMLT